MKNQTYIHYRLFGKPVVTVPAEPRSFRLIGLRCIQPATFRRKIARLVLTVAYYSRLDWIFSRRLQTPIETEPKFRFDRWQSELRNKLSLPGQGVVIMKPPQLERRRTYVHFLGPEKRPIAFAKIAHDSTSSNRFLQEANSLREVEALNLPYFRTPHVIDFQYNHEYCSLVTESIPGSARPFSSGSTQKLEKGIRELTKPNRYFSTSAIATLSWWNEFQREPNNEAFMSDLESSLGQNFLVCRAHGDLSPTNILQDGDDLWLFDWEDSCSDAPIYSDKIGFHLSHSMTESLRDPIAALHCFEKDFLEKNVSTIPRADVLLALAFRHACGLPDARIFIQNWHKLINSIT